MLIKISIVGINQFGLASVFLIAFIINNCLQKGAGLINIGLALHQLPP